VAHAVGGVVLVVEFVIKFVVRAVLRGLAGNVSRAFRGWFGVGLGQDGAPTPGAAPGPGRVDMELSYSLTSLTALGGANPER